LVLIVHVGVNHPHVVCFIQRAGELVQLYVVKREI